MKTQTINIYALYFLCSIKRTINKMKFAFFNRAWIRFLILTIYTKLEFISIKYNEKYQVQKITENLRKQGHSHSLL